MKYEIVAVGGGKEDGRDPRHNRVIFTRDLGGDFARKENAAPLSSRARAVFLFLFYSNPPRPPVPFPYLGREIRPVGAISM